MTSWDEGFDAGMAGNDSPDYGPYSKFEAEVFKLGLMAALGYQNAIRNRPAEPRDTKILYIEEFLECQPK